MVEKDWEARFAERHTARPSLLQLIRTRPAKIAAAYWIFVLLVFFALQATGFDMIASGAIPLAALTIPWSLLVMAATSSISSVPSQTLFQPFISTVGTFLIFAIGCGGLNAVFIFVLVSALERRQRRTNRP